MHVAPRTAIESILQTDVTLCIDPHFGANARMNQGMNTTLEQKTKIVSSDKPFNPGMGIGIALMHTGGERALWTSSSCSVCSCCVQSAEQSGLWRESGGETVGWRDGERRKRKFEVVISGIDYDHYFTNVVYDQSSA